MSNLPSAVKECAQTIVDWRMLTTYGQRLACMVYMLPKFSAGILNRQAAWRYFGHMSISTLVAALGSAATTSLSSWTLQLVFGRVLDLVQLMNQLPTYVLVRQTLSGELYMHGCPTIVYLICGEYFHGTLICDSFLSCCLPPLGGCERSHW